MITFQLFHIQFRVSVLFCGLLALLAYTDKTGLIPAAVPAVLLHELGHWLVLRQNGDLLEEIIIKPGAVALKGSFNAGWSAQCRMYLSGPVSNLACAGLLFCCHCCFKSPLFWRFGLCQAGFGLFHLLPVTGLDGGSILACLAQQFLPGRRARLLCRAVSAAVCAGMLLLFTVLWLQAPQKSQLLPGIYLFLSLLLRKAPLS